MNPFTESDRYLPLVQSGLDSPILLLDTQAPLKELHAYTSLRLSMTTRFLDSLANLDCAAGDEHDVSAIAGTVQLLMQEACDVNRVIEYRLWRNDGADQASEMI